MRREIVVLENEKIRGFENLLHKAKGKDTLNMFLEKSNINPLYIEWCICGRSFVIPHDGILKRISDSSDGRVSFEELKYIFKGYTQPKIKNHQIWFGDIKNDAKGREGAYYIIDDTVGESNSYYVKVCPVVRDKENYQGNNIKLKYRTKDGIKIESMILLDDYIIIERKYLLSYIASPQDEYSFDSVENHEQNSISRYIKSIFN